MERNRRQLLQTSGALLASATALAGCLSNGSTTTEPNGQADGTATETPMASATGTDVSTETPTETPATGTTLANADYAEWLPAPSALGTDHYEFQSAAFSALFEYEDVLPSSIFENLQRSTGLPEVDAYSDIDAHHFVGEQVQVVEASFDRATVVSGFEEQLDFERTGDHGGYALLAAGSRAAAIGDDALLLGGTMGGNSLSPADLVTAVIDAKAGEGDRYTDASEDVSALVSHLDGGHVVGGRSHEVGATFDGAAAEGVATVVGDPDSTVRTATVFESGAANADAVSSWASEASMYGDQSPETTTDGRVVQTAAAVPTGSFDQLPSDFPGPDIPETSDVPQVAFAFEYEETGDGVGLLTITHEGGDSVPAATLYLRGDGFATVDGADQTDSGQWQGDTSDEGTVQAGHAVDVGVTDDYELTVVWESESGDRSATLSANEGPEA